MKLIKPEYVYPNPKVGDKVKITWTKPVTTIETIKEEDGVVIRIEPNGEVVVKGPDTTYLSWYNGPDFVEPKVVRKFELVEPVLEFTVGTVFIAHGEDSNTSSVKYRKVIADLGTHGVVVETNFKNGSKVASIWTDRTATKFYIPYDGEL